MTSRSVWLTGAVVVWAVATVLAGHEPAPPGRGPWTYVAPQGTPAAASRVDFTRDIEPLLNESCLDCHSQDKRKGGLSLATYGDILDGGKDGPIVRPGSSATSMLIHRVTGDVGERMPKDGAPLTSAEVTLLRRWIDEGARATPTSAPAPAPWEAELALGRPALPEVIWAGWSAPADRIVAAYLRARGRAEPRLVSDTVFARRVYLDLWGLLPTSDQLQSFLTDHSADKRPALVARLLADNEKYAEHWISFWNDLLRNEDGVNYYSETAGRRSVTPWLLDALYTNRPYDQFVRTLLNPETGSAAEGFLTGVNWRGETSAAVTPWMQAAQNTAQVFLGVNLKCNACHDSFVNKWKLKDAYGLASFFSPDGRLQLFRCDIAQDAYAEPAFLYPEINRAPASMSLADRRTAVAAIFTDPRNGRLPRTIANRLWQRLVGAGIVAVPDEMDGRPWSPALLDWLASDFVDHGFDLKQLIATIVSSRAYQLPSVPRQGDVLARDYAFAGPEVRRLSAEQFADAIGSITGEWGISRLNIGRAGGTAASGAAAAAPVAAQLGRGTPSDPPSVGRYVREWRMPSTHLSRALGRPVRDQVTSVRATQATTPQGLELVNGEILTRALLAGARRMLDERLPEPTSLYNKAVAGRQARPAPFDIDVSTAQRLWLVVQETGSNDPERVLPVWARAELVDLAGTVTPLSALTPLDPAGLRSGTGPVAVGSTLAEAVRVRNPSTLSYDISGRGFAAFRGVMWLENPASDIGATLDPQTRFFVFSAPPNMDRLLPPAPDVPLPALPVVTTARQAVDRVFMHALGRAPSVAERRIAEAALQDPTRPGRVSVEGLADLLWAVVMKPEFQLIY